MTQGPAYGRVDVPERTIGVKSFPESFARSLFGASFQNVCLSTSRFARGESAPNYLAAATQYRFRLERMNSSPSLTAGVALKSPPSESKRLTANCSNFGPSFSTNTLPARVAK